MTVSGRASIVLPGLPSSAKIGREFVRERLGSWAADGRDAELIVHELIVNAVMHVGSPVNVTVRTSDGGVRVEVKDKGTGPFPERLRPPLLPAGRGGPGRGLAIVDAVATKWGVDWLPYGKRVWATLAR